MAKTGGIMVVVGGGASGTTAAIRAKQLGSEHVILLEAASQLGGNAGPISPVPLLDPERLTDAAIEQESVEMMQYTDWTSDPRIVRTLLEWCQDSRMVQGERC